MVLGLLALPFAVFAPFAIFSATRSLLRIRASHGELSGEASAATGLFSGIVGLMVFAGGVTWWVVAS